MAETHQICGDYPDGAFQKVKEIKERSGLTWPAFIIKAADSFENEPKATK